MSSRRYITAKGKPMRNAMRMLLAAVLSISAVTGPISASAAPIKSTPQRGGTLEFAVDAEPPNYDCHSNISFAFIHPVDRVSSSAAASSASAAAPTGTAASAAATRSLVMIMAVLALSHDAHVSRLL